MSCDPATLVDGAKCIECAIPPGMLLPVLILLTAQANGIAIDPATWVNDARCIQCGIPIGMQLPVLISLTCKSLP